MPQTNKLLGLEVLRFFSALSVLFWHYQNLAAASYEKISFITKSQPFSNIFSLFYNYGAYGVHVFWCISGFIFFYKYGDQIKQNKVSWSNFFIMRFSRLYPLHIATLLLVVCLQYLYIGKTGNYFIYKDNSVSHFIQNIIFASGWIHDEFSFNAPVWSVSAEVVVYFTFYLIAFKFGPNFYAVLTAIAICIFLNKLKISSPIIDCALIFYVGGLAYSLKKISIKTNLKNLVYLSACVISVTFPLIVLFETFYKNKYFIFILTTCYLPTLIYALSFGVSRNSFLTRIIQTAGNLTYSSYLLHFPIQLAIATICTYQKISLPFYEPWFLIAFLGAVFFTSYISYYYFEFPLQQKIRAYWRSGEVT